MINQDWWFTTLLVGGFLLVAWHDLKDHAADRLR
jgi:hypothetical protein